MVSKLFKLLNRDIVSMNQAALVLAVFSVLSQLFGLLRDRLLASVVGPSAALDVYYAAFRIPDFIYNSFGILFSVTVLIPFITQFITEEKNTQNGSLKSFLNSIFTVYTVGMAILCAVLIVAMPWLTKLTAPGFSIAQQSDLVLYARIMLLSPFLFGLSSLLSSFAQVQKKFFSFAIAPLFYNVGILLGIIVLLPRYGVLGVVLGVVLGATLQFVIQVPTLVALHKIPRLTSAIDWAVIKRVMKLSLPRTLGSSLTNITFIVMSAIASYLAVGSISVFQFAYNIENTPLLIIGISYAVAAFPTMTRLFAEGNKKEFLAVLYRATRTILFLAIPVSLMIIVLRAHIVRILLGAGVFSWGDTRLVAACVALFSISVAAQCIVLLFVRAFFATGDTRTPLKINSIAVLVTIVSSAALLLIYTHNLFFQNFLNHLMRVEGVEGTTIILLPLGFSIGQITNALLLWRGFHKTFHGTKVENGIFGRTVLHMLAAGIIAATASYGTLLFSGGGVKQTTFFAIFAQAIVAGGVGVVAYAITLIALKNEDIYVFLDTIRSKFWKQKPIVVPGQQEL